jgi:lysophospholipase L1-like esterase
MVFLPRYQLSGGALLFQKERRVQHGLRILGVFIILAGGLQAADPDPLCVAEECRIRNGLPNLFARLEQGKAVNVAYLGGSITAAPGWRPKSLDWFKKTWPKAEVSEINAAIGGTGSDLGVFRLYHDVLQHKPDLVFVEFAVNDGGAPPDRIHRSMEGIVRQIRRDNPETDICYVYTLAHNMIRDLQAGKFPRAASSMEAVADHYGIPSVHFGVEVAKREKKGTLIFKGKGKEQEGKMVFSGDGVHPHADTGHEVYREVLARSLLKMKGHGEAGPYALPEPLVADNWENATMIPLDRLNPGKGWSKMNDGLAKRFGKRLPGLWKATDAGAKLSFTFTGTRASIYDLLGPDCGMVVVNVDDKAPVTRPRMDGYCTYHRLATLVVAVGLEDGEHRVEIALQAEQPDKRKILHDHRRPDFDKNPGKYDDNAWYAGALLLLGELSE